MKRYEDFNNITKTNETAEEQAVGMTIESLREDLGLDLNEFETDNYVTRFRVYLDWLKEEVE